MMRVPLGTFTKVAHNFRGLLAARGEGPYPSVVAQFLIDRRNCADLPRMYALGRELGADRIAISLVLDIPLERIDRGLLLGPLDTDLIRPGLEEILKADRDAHLLQIYFPVAEWNAAMAEIKQRIGYGAEENLFPIASSYQEKNGHCFFGWYTAVIRGTGEMYPCCLLMQPGYKPLGNAINGRFVDQWNGPGFTRLREEHRDVFLQGEAPKYDPAKHQVLKEYCVEAGKCWLKNIYFREDEKFYADLGRALEKARRRDRLRHPVAHAYRKAKTVAKRLKGSLR
jgi:MoaA/NifB/PqqE/SkfB family radical SAM enzyme